MHHDTIMLLQAPVLLLWVLSRRGRSHSRLMFYRQSREYAEAHEMRMAFVRRGGDPDKLPELTHDNARAWIDLRTRPPMLPPTNGHEE